MNPLSYDILGVNVEFIFVPDYGKCYSPYFSFGFGGNENVVTVFIALRECLSYFIIDFIFLYPIIIGLAHYMPVHVCVTYDRWSESP